MRLVITSFYINNTNFRFSIFKDNSTNGTPTGQTARSTELENYEGNISLIENKTSGGPLQLIL